jgi:hypothetical protein
MALWRPTGSPRSMGYTSKRRRPVALPIGLGSAAIEALYGKAVSFNVAHRPQEGIDSRWLPSTLLGQDGSPKIGVPAPAPPWDLYAARSWPPRASQHPQPRHQADGCRSAEVLFWGRICNVGIRQRFEQRDFYPLNSFCRGYSVVGYSTRRCTRIHGNTRGICAQSEAVPTGCWALAGGASPPCGSRSHLYQRIGTQCLRRHDRRCR